MRKRDFFNEIMPERFPNRRERRAKEKRFMGNSKNYHPTKYLQLIFNENSLKNRAIPKVIKHEDK